MKARAIDFGKIPSSLDQDIWNDFGSSGTRVYSDFARNRNVLQSHVLLAACRSEELAFERTNGGLFTNALLKTLKDTGIDKLTYASLLNKMPTLAGG